MNEIIVRRMPDGTYCINVNGRLVDEDVPFEHLGVHVASVQEEYSPSKVIYRGVYAR
jgi:hypothetical protein